MHRIEAELAGPVSGRVLSRPLDDFGHLHARLIGGQTLGTSQLAATWLVQTAGSRLAPARYVVVRMARFAPLVTRFSFCNPAAIAFRNGNGNGADRTQA
ncbi:hypothetical protein LFL97_28925 [Burkholderia sp. JSH-S8]|nr:hypothetical protein LFL97_28925 [Burkholderia sp. JSH-S8]